MKNKETINDKDYLVYLTKNIRSMGRNSRNVQGVSKKVIKKSWHKRVRGIYKSQTKEIL